MKLMSLVIFFLALLLSSCSAENIPQPVQVDTSLPDLGPAPELTNETWLNSETPLRLADLVGKVVLIDMWTFG